MTVSADKRHGIKQDIILLKERIQKDNMNLMTNQKIVHESEECIKSLELELASANKSEVLKERKQNNLNVLANATELVRILQEAIEVNQVTLEALQRELA
ncbi:hypothetical protein EDD11_001690 [Mortierella claussenii]|nr:hypothetical protein EDD11_001690 [Mortierella claussenii]